jgi:NAD(P)-dependent dehydrogenase (short-subunit alcohol dehydrogenase family)
MTSDSENRVDLSNGMYGLPAGSFRLDGKMAVVTGASRNIGLSLSLALAQAGADIVMVARGAERLEDAAEAVRAAVPERRIEQCPADVGTTEGAGRIADFVHNRFGAADILVNCAHSSAKAGISADLGILDIPDSMWIETFNTNVLGAYRLIKGLFAGHARDGKEASVINIVSGSGLLPVPVVANCPYGSSKAALWMMTRYLAVNLAPRIRVNAICPGNVSPTGEPHNATSRRMLPEIPMGRVGRPSEIAGAAVYLASSAASFTTGEVIICNGGRAW